jgi:flavin reductase (DIM6/NTAB) family NADH-FMN oxidoreductase RutF
MSFDSLELRNALGNFATGICVITTNDGCDPMGITVNSFAAVSLEPALVLWSLQNNSECFAVFEKTKKYAVNILSVEQQDLSNLYASKGDHRLAPEHFRIGKSGLPVLRQCVASFECDIWSRYPGGDHVVLLGEVSHIETNSNKKPLLFSAGQYRRLG